ADAHLLRLRRRLAREASAQVKQSLSECHVGRLDRHRVQRPEAALDEAEELPPSKPSHREENEEHEDRAEPTDTVRRDLAPPHAREHGCGAEHQRRHDDEQAEGEAELRQADFGQQVAGDREQRPALRARRVRLDVAVARIRQRDAQRRGRFPERRVVLAGGMERYSTAACHASLAPLMTNCIAIAARSSPMMRVMTRIPVTPIRATTLSPIRSTIQAIAIVTAMERKTAIFCAIVDAWPDSTMIVEMAPGPASIGIASGARATSSFASPSAISCLPSWVRRSPWSMSIATTQRISP